MREAASTYRAQGAHRWRLSVYLAIRSLSRTRGAAPNQQAENKNNDKDEATYDRGDEIHSQSLKRYRIAPPRLAQPRRVRRSRGLTSVGGKKVRLMPTLFEYAVIGLAAARGRNILDVVGCRCAHGTCLGDRASGIGDRRRRVRRTLLAVAFVMTVKAPRHSRTRGRRICPLRRLPPRIVVMTHRARRPRYWRDRNSAGTSLHSLSTKRRKWQSTVKTRRAARSPPGRHSPHRAARPSPRGR